MREKVIPLFAHVHDLDRRQGPVVNPFGKDKFFVFAVLGVIADAANTSLGLSPMTWLLLAIAAFAASAASFISWAVAWYLKNTEDKKEQP